MRALKTSLLATSTLAGVAALLAVSALPSAAFAQDAPVDDDPQTEVVPGLSPEEATSAAATADQAETGAVTEVEGLVVTGSHLRRTDFTSAAPIEVITAEESELKGLVDTGTILQTATVASGSFQANNLLSGYVITGGQNVNTISLRGLGAERTLVLLNGRRLPPSGQGGTVGPIDLNVIPSSVIDRVEILKDGASSIYGSDAVAGVVNLITKRDTDGIEMTGTAIVPGDSGGRQYRLSATYGKVLDRGYFTVSGDYTELTALKAYERDMTSCAADYLFDPDTHEPVDFTDPATGKAKCYDAINAGWQSYDVYGGVFIWDPDQSNAPPGGYPAAATTTEGILPDWVRCCRAGQPATYPYGPYQNEEVLNTDVISPVKRYSLFATGAYDLTPGIEAYGELLLNRREDTATYYQYLFEWVYPSNPNNTVAEGLQEGGASGYARPLITFPYNSEVEVDYYRLLGGLRGTFHNLPFLDGWDWDVYVQGGKSEAKYTADFIYQDRIYALTGPGVACDQDQITISGGDCSDLPGGIPWFTDRVLNGDLTDAERNFIKSRETGTTDYEQWMVEGSISGDIFQLPAGPLSGAFGAVYRHDELDDQPGFNAQNANYWGFSTTGRTAGDDSVREVWGELEAPLLRDLILVDRLTANISGRYTDYDSYGSDSTYKIGLDWQVIPSFRLRATKGTAFRAPALFELYLADQTAFFSGNDPCARWEESSDPAIQANCESIGIPEGYTGPGETPMVTSGGGAGLLKAETSEAETIGFVYTPPMFNLSIAVDYFEFEVNNEVATFGSTNILNSCYGAPPSQFPNDFCTLITRDPDTHDITEIRDNYLNINQQLNRGLDLNVRYVHELNIGKFTLEGQFTWQFEDVTNLLGGSATDYNGSTTEPDFTGQVNLQYDYGDWTGFWSVDMYGKASDTEIFEDDVFPSNRYMQYVYYKQYTEFTAYHTLSVRKVFDDLTVHLGVQNLFDEPPPAQSAAQFRFGTAALNAYDLRGRRAFITLTKKW